LTACKPYFIIQVIVRNQNVKNFIAIVFKEDYNVHQNVHVLTVKIIFIMIFNKNKELLYHYKKLIYI